MNMIQTTILKAEWIKNKSLVNIWIMVLYPILVVLLIGSSYFFRDLKHFQSSIWDGFFDDLFSTWTLLFLPIYCLITTYSVFSVENYTHNWRNLFVLGVERKTIINHKFLLVLLYNLIGSSVLIVFAIISMIVLKFLRPLIPMQIDFFNPNFPKILSLFFITSLAMIVIFSALNILVKSVISPFIIGAFLSFVNLFIAVKKISIYYPISYPCTVYYKLSHKEKFATFLYVSCVIFLLGIFLINLLINKYFNKKKL